MTPLPTRYAEACERAAELLAPVCSDCEGLGVDSDTFARYACDECKQDTADALDLRALAKALREGFFRASGESAVITLVVRTLPTEASE